MIMLVYYRHYYKHLHIEAWAHILRIIASLCPEQAAGNDLWNARARKFIVLLNLKTLVIVMHHKPCTIANTIYARIEAFFTIDAF